MAKAERQVPLRFTISGSFIRHVVVLPFGILLHFPFRKLPLALLAFIESKNVRQQNPCDGFNLMLRDTAVVYELLSSSQGNPPLRNTWWLTV